MTDIVEKLRTEAQEIRSDMFRPRFSSEDETMDKAADEIERLRKELTEVKRYWGETHAKLAASRAREAKLRDYFPDKGVHLAGENDDTALKEAIKQAKREVLKQANEVIWDYWKDGVEATDQELRRMAEELK